MIVDRDLQERLEEALRASRGQLGELLPLVEAEAEKVKAFRNVQRYVVQRVTSPLNDAMKQTLSIRDSLRKLISNIETVEKNMSIYNKGYTRHEASMLVELAKVRELKEKHDAERKY